MEKIDNELNKILNRYYFLIKTFQKVANDISIEMKDSNMWFAFIGKLSNKFLINLKSYVFNITQGIVKIEIDEIQISNNLDISCLYTNLRLQIDTYTTFHHIFIHEGNWEEKIIRFRLWQMDSLISRQNYNLIKSPEINSQINYEKLQIDNIYNIINNLYYFKNLKEPQKKKLIKKKNNEITFANWKFDSNILNSKKDKYSWEELTLKSGMKNEIYNDIHSFSSMHVHSNYISILQNDQLTEANIIEIRIVAIQFSSLIISLFLDDLCYRFSSAKKTIDSLSLSEIEIIKSLLKNGRNKEKIKYFSY